MRMSSRVNYDYHVNGDTSVRDKNSDKNSKNSLVTYIIYAWSLTSAFNLSNDP